MKVAIGSDHGGVALKAEIIAYLEANGYEYEDFGTNDTKSVDYPTYGLAVAEAIKDGKADRGILVCGTGIGIGISANKVPGIRCAMVSDAYSAQMTREHNDANMLAMGARVTGPGFAVEIVKCFLGTEFSNDERHIRRIKQIEG